MELDRKHKLIEIIRSSLGIPDSKEILESHDLVDDLGADSLDLAQIQMLLDDEFSTDLPDDKFENIRDLTIERIIYIIDCIQAENIDLDVNSIDDSLISLEDCVYGSESNNLALELAKFIHNTCSSVPHDIGLRLIQEIKIFYEKRLDGYIENKKEEDSIETKIKKIIKKEDPSLVPPIPLMMDDDCLYDDYHLSIDNLINICNRIEKEFNIENMPVVSNYIELSDFIDNMCDQIENNDKSIQIENNDKSIQIDLSDDVFMTIAKEAHERDITFNDMVNIILKESIDEK